ncbi:hypothetical protein AOCH_000702 [Aspergillus ochraceoroseus]|uniref:Uncharacterized protein n=1 Tax=Aspergillus ochraceoroseus TaxID=138278 RepID=A0A0F8TXS0_9EURO|nr:hypothetical protein AOCH_000702 [Aspergillus ochraceoroseus]
MMEYAIYKTSKTLWGCCTQWHPSLAEPISLRAPPKSLLKTEGGYNKENLIGYGEAYKHDDEIQGTVKQPPASFPSYLPVWDNETERLVFASPQLVISDPGLRRSM